MAEIKSEGYMAQNLKAGNNQGTGVCEKYSTSRHNVNKTDTIFPSFEFNHLFSV